MGLWPLMIACSCVSGREQTCTAISSQARVGKPPSLVRGICRWRSHHFTQRSVSVTRGATAGGGAVGRGAAPTRWNHRTWSTGRTWSTDTSTAIGQADEPQSTRRMGTRAMSINSIEKLAPLSAYCLTRTDRAQCTRRSTSTGISGASGPSRRVKQTTSTSLPGVSTRNAALPTSAKRPKFRPSARRHASSTVATSPCCVSRSCCMCESIAASISMRKTSPECADSCNA
mmetsp:Transcript_29371/g.51463  ORF Transcript_29371/g.51463 Transcript_29371/m.51463 type:complete len:229 (-) Transcript_29371:765-1451(-)